MSILEIVTERLTSALGAPQKGSVEEWHGSYQRVLSGFPAEALKKAVQAYLDTRRYDTWPKPEELKKLAERGRAEMQVNGLVFVPRGYHPEYTLDWLAMAKHRRTSPQALICSSRDDGTAGWWFERHEYEAAKGARAA